MMMKSVFWWRKPKYPEETTDLRQVTDETFHTYSSVHWGLTPPQQPGSYQGSEMMMMMMMMKSVIWWRKPEYPEETTDLQQYGLCPVRGLKLGRSSVKQSELRRDESVA